MKHRLDIQKYIEYNMTAYASYHNPKAHNNKGTTKTREQPAHQMNVAQQHHYLDVNKSPTTLDAQMMTLHS